MARTLETLHRRKVDLMNLRLLEMPDLMVKHAHLSVALRIRAAKPHRAMELVMKDGLLREVN